MKKFKVCIFPLIIIAIFCFTSCGPNEPADLILSNPNTNPNPGTSKGTFKVDFKDATWTSSLTEVIISGNFISIAATNAKSESFGIFIDGSALGAYAANKNILAYVPSADSEYAYWGLNDDNPDENTGSVTITNINTTTKTISGTFNFKGYWSNGDVSNIAPIEFTNGVFTDLPYINQEETNDVFYAKVGGVEFVDVDIVPAMLGINGQDFIVIGAQDALSNEISVSVRSNEGPGTYSITGVNTDLAQAFYTFDDIEYRAVSGSITITSKTDDRIQGTFNFVTSGTNPFTVTAGAFDVEY